MARPRHPHSDDRLPPPLPPETRTVGQLVAEALRLYGRRFWPSLALGLSLATINQLSAGRSIAVQVGVVCAGAPLLTASYIGATALAGGVRPGRREALTAFAGGVLVFLPAPFLALLFALPAVAWLALLGLVVPVAVLETSGLRAAFARALALARADYVHALGSLATLTITFVLTRLVLVFLLKGQAGATVRVASFLADLVISPVIFLGAALLYYDQAARLQAGPRPGRSRNAHLHHAHLADGGRPADAEVEPRAAAQGQP